MTDVINHPAYIEGKNHYKVAGGAYSNPYRGDSENYNYFERGWAQALKRDDMNIGEQLFVRLGRKKKPKRHKSATTKEQYLRRKG